MSILLNCQNLSKSYGGRSLFDRISFGIFRKDRIGLIGPNGSGKSTLLKIIAGLDHPDEGSIAKGRSLRVGYVPQETTFGNQTILSILTRSLVDDPHLSEEQKEVQAKTLLTQLGFEDLEKIASSLSGGWQKRLAVAQQLMLSPDVLLLDEPTNHLDLEGVLWLEEFLKEASFSYIVISHDRYFLEHTTNKMMELNKSYPKGLFIVEGAYSQFLEKREEFLSGQMQQERSLASKVRREVEWLKQNPKARTTKSTSRIQEAHRLIGELDNLKQRNKTEQSSIDFSGSKRESQKLLTATNLGKSIEGKELFSGIHFTLSPGTRLGIVGCNGSGKTTLLRILAGELRPDKGTIKTADKIKIVYFDQQRSKIAGSLSLRRALAPEGDTVFYLGQPIHVNSWCKKFLFSPDRLDLPFENLSGGEKARVHIARLMLQPADILLLDEPTNDLDISTLELLEESLQDFPGAVVLISHDRYMLDQLSNRLLGLGVGNESTIFADYRQWESHQTERSKEAAQKEKKEKNPPFTPPPSPPSSKKMNYAEKREWEQMEGKILLLEQEIEELHRLIELPETRIHTEKLKTLCHTLDQKQQALDTLFHRWQELETKYS